MARQLAPLVSIFVGTLVAVAASASAQPTAWHERQRLLREATERFTGLRRNASVPLPPFDRMGDARNDTSRMPGEVVTTGRPEDYLPTEALPVAWDWRSVTVASDSPPVHFTTRVRNQFLPHWCGSCWAHAATAVLGSRWLIHSKTTTTTTLSGIDFSVQYFVNCVNGTEGGTWTHPTRGCNGGSAFEAFAHAHKFGAVDSSCLPYAAVTQQCSANNTCEQNLHGAAGHTVAPIRYHTSEFGFVGTADTTPAEREPLMRKEIYARGPIAACMACPREFEDDYKGGVLATKNPRTVCDHIVAIVGFGGEGSSAYWIVQNSFGSVWGESGYFRIKRASALQAGEHNLGIESPRVSWAMP